MSYLNSVTIVGFVGADPEERQARNNGSKFTVLSVSPRNAPGRTRRMSGPRKPSGTVSALYGIKPEVNLRPPRSFPNKPFRFTDNLRPDVVLLLTISRRGVFSLSMLRGSALMADKSSDLVQGTLDMLILKTLALEPMHGYGVAVRIEQISRGVFRVNAGSLFVAFQRLQRAGLIRSEWKATENSRRAKYYVLTEEGRKRLNSETQEWERQVAAITRILEAS
jgi:PadR family transcriptional regulator PadR